MFAYNNPRKQTDKLDVYEPHEKELLNAIRITPNLTHEIHAKLQAFGSVSELVVKLCNNKASLIKELLHVVHLDCEHRAIDEYVSVSGAFAENIASSPNFYSIDHDWLFECLLDVVDGERVYFTAAEISSLQPDTFEGVANAGLIDKACIRALCRRDSDKARSIVLRFGNEQKQRMFLMESDFTPTTLTKILETKYPSVAEYALDSMFTLYSSNPHYFSHLQEKDFAKWLVNKETALPAWRVVSLNKERIVDFCKIARKSHDPAVRLYACTSYWSIKVTEEDFCLAKKQIQPENLVSEIFPTPLTEASYQVLASIIQNTTGIDVISKVVETVNYEHLKVILSALEKPLSGYSKVQISKLNLLLSLFKRAEKCGVRFSFENNKDKNNLEFFHPLRTQFSNLGVFAVQEIRKLLTSSDVSEIKVGLALIGSNPQDYTAELNATLSSQCDEQIKSQASSILSDIYAGKSNLGKIKVIINKLRTLTYQAASWLSKFFQ